MLRGELGIDGADVPRTLPYDLPDFSGRHADMNNLFATAAVAPIVAIDGMAGVGKTALVVHLAHRLADRFPDGQLYCDLRGHTPEAEPLSPQVALELLLRMVGVPDQQIPDGPDARSARWRSTLAGRRILVVLDNAASAGQVRAMLPAGAECLTIVTSRARLGELEGACLYSLDVMDRPEALALLDRVVGAGRVGAEPEAAGAVIELCGRLPLAIRLAASRLAQRPLWTVAGLSDKLRDGSGRRSLLAVPDRGVDAAFALSYEHLSAAAQRVFRLLGRHPAADFDAYAAAAMTQLPVGDAERLLEGLVDAHLLQQRIAGRYTFHDLLRHYARRLADSDPRVTAAEPVNRLRDYYLAAATVASDLINREVRRFVPVLRYPPHEQPAPTDRDAALRWLAAERATLLAVALTGDGWQLPCVLRSFFEQRGYFGDWRSTHQHALRHAGDDPLAVTVIQLSLGALEGWQENHEGSMAHFRLALDSGLDDPELAAAALNTLAMHAHQTGSDADAVRYAKRALAQPHNNLRVRAMSWCNLAMPLARLGRTDAALRHHRRALEVAIDSREPSVQCAAYLGLGETALRLDIDAGGYFRKALDLARLQRYRIQEAIALDGLAHATSNPEYWRVALVIYTELGVRRRDLMRRHLEEPGTVCCDLCRPPGGLGVRHLAGGGPAR